MTTAMMTKIGGDKGKGGGEGKHYPCYAVKFI